MAPTSASSSKAKLGRRKRAAGANKGVGIDFKKVKHKIGKRLPRAANDTNTEVRAKAIALPGQRTLTADKAGAAVSARGLTLGELLAQWPHPSDKVRKGALQQAGELLQAHPELVARNAGPLVARVCERLSDGSPTVRQALVASLLKPPSPLLPQLRRCGALAAFSPLIAAHLSASLTHLDAGVRADALAALEAVAEASPSALAAPPSRLAGWLGHYSALLSRAHRGRTVRAQALAPLARVLGSAARVTRRLVAQDQVQTQQAVAASLPLGAGRAAAAALAPSAGGGTLTPAALMRVYCGNQAQQQQQEQADASTVDEVQAAALGLLEAAFGCWAECAPGALSTAPEAEAAGALRDVLAAGNQLVPLALGPEPLREARSDGATTTASASQLPSSAATARLARAARCARAVLPRLLPHFPSREPALPPTPDVADAVARYNLEAAQLLAALVAALSPAGGGGGAGAAEAGDGAASSSKSAAAASLGALQAKARAALVDYLCSALSTGRAVPGGGGEGGGGAAGDAAAQKTAGAGAPPSGGSNATALACLRAARVALPALPAGGDERRELLAAVCAAGSPAGGKRARGGEESGGGGGGGGGGGAGVLAARLALQRDLLEAHLLLSRGRRRRLEGDDEAEYDSDADAEAEEEMAAWLTGAPRLLWEAAARSRRAAASGNPAATAAAEAALAAVASPLLSMMHTAARLCAPQSPLEDALRTVQQMLAPLLAVAAPSPQAGGGGAASAPAAVVPGPLASLPAASQELGLSLLAHLPGPLDAALLKAVAMALRCPSAPKQQQQQPQSNNNKRRRPAAADEDGDELAADKSAAGPPLAYSDAAASRLLEAVLLAAAPPRAALPPEAYLSFVATLLAGASSSSSSCSSSSPPFARHRLVAACVAQRLHWYGPPARLAELAATPLLSRWEEARSGGGAGTAADARRALAFSLLSLSAAAAAAWTPALGGDASGEAAWAARAEARSLHPLEGEDDSGGAIGLGLPQALAARLPSVVEDWVWGSAAAAAEDGAGGGASAAAAAAETAVVEALPLLAQRCLAAHSGGGESEQEDPALQVLNLLLRAGLGEEEQQEGEENEQGAAAALSSRLERGGMAVAALRAALAVVDCPRIHEAWRAGTKGPASAAAGARALAAARKLRAAVGEASGGRAAATDADVRAARRLETRLAECFGDEGAGE
jgi:pre-rRNA-processing protein IPI1